MSHAEASSSSLQHLAMPSDDPATWAHVQEVLSMPLESLADLDKILTSFAALDREPRRCSFFAEIPGTAEAGKFDFESFFAAGVPLMLAVALEMPTLFAGVEVPIHKMRSSWPDERQVLGKKSFSLTRRQTACLLAHSFSAR
jgi:hypothetical protein